jgi:hypothetical protein
VSSSLDLSTRSLLRGFFYQLICTYFAFFNFERCMGGVWVGFALLFPAYMNIPDGGALVTPRVGFDWLLVLWYFFIIPGRTL